jgi:hypothetical protein
MSYLLAYYLAIGIAWISFRAATLQFALWYIPELKRWYRPCPLLELALLSASWPADFFYKAWPLAKFLFELPATRRQLRQMASRAAGAS